VTRFEYRLHPLPHLHGGIVLHPRHRGGQLLRFFREYTAEAPDSLSTLLIYLGATTSSAVPPELRHDAMYAVAFACTAAPAEAERLTAPLREFGPPTFATFGPTAYTALQSTFDADVPHGTLTYQKSCYQDELTDAAVDTIVSHCAAMPTPVSRLYIHQLGGAVARVGEEETAFSHRSAAYNLSITGVWETPAAAEQARAWVGDFWTAMRPHARSGAYVNFLADSNDHDAVLAAYGEAKYRRLASLKARHDPTNVFRLNQNITPAMT
jgi:Berberine and berberine like